ncbi:MAG: hypothetical protein CMB22_03720 [Euryarchaeota archaeon]|nr:hypothetical protein [Euryarchaeota archaeon]
MFGASPGAMSRTVLAWVVERVDAGERVAMASVISASGSVPGKPGARLAVSSDGTKFGTVGGAGLEMMVENALRDLLKVSASETRKIGGRVETFILHKDGKGKEAVALDSLCGGRVTVAMEVVEPVPHILISGGGHVGRSVAIVCDTLGWKHSVFDVRKEFANDDRYPFAEEIHSGPVSDFFNSGGGKSISRFTDVLILGHDWEVDQEFLIGCLKRNSDGAARIGVIGSTNKWKGFRDAAIKSGIDEMELSSARCPIGLDIGADSPEEIAVAICAEILAMERMPNSDED